MGQDEVELILVCGLQNLPETVGRDPAIQPVPEEWVTPQLLCPQKAERPA